MYISIFDLLDSSMDVINSQRDFIELAADKITDYFMKEMSSQEELLNVTSRIKSESSIKEKIIRNNYLTRNPSQEELFESFPDLVGVRFECRFNEDEKTIFEAIAELFSIYDDDLGLFHSEGNSCIYLNLKDKQPQVQKNGFDIYKIDGYYIEKGKQLRFEIQIKSMVNLFWGEIDHRVLYKNFSYMMTEDFVREIMYSIKNNLNTIDSQLSLVYKSLKEPETSNWDSTKRQLKGIVSKVIHDTYTVQLMNKTNVLFDLSNTANLITDYIFAQILFDTDIDFEKAVIELMNEINEVSRDQTRIGEALFIEPVFSNTMSEKFGQGLLERINTDFKWNLCFHIIFDQTKKKPSEEFVTFVEYIIYILHYRVKKAVFALDLSLKDKEELTDALLVETLKYFSIEYDIDRFNLENMRVLQKACEKYLMGIEKPEELLALDFDDFPGFLGEFYEKE